MSYTSAQCFLTTFALSVSVPFPVAPLGDDGFLEEMEQTFHRTWRRGHAEKTSQITEVCQN